MRRVQRVHLVGIGGVGMSGLAEILHARGYTILRARHYAADAVVLEFGAHEIAPTPDGTAVWMANPFSAVETTYPVETPHMRCYANCAWDALGVPAILGTDGWTKTECAESGTPLEFGVRGGVLEGDDGVIHLVTPLRDAWVDIGFT